MNLLIRKSSRYFFSFALLYQGVKAILLSPAFLIAGKELNTTQFNALLLPSLLLLFDISNIRLTLPALYISLLYLMLMVFFGITFTLNSSPLDTSFLALLFMSFLFYFLSYLYLTFPGYNPVIFKRVSKYILFTCFIFVLTIITNIYLVGGLSVFNPHNFRWLFNVTAGLSLDTVQTMSNAYQTELQDGAPIFAGRVLGYLIIVLSLFPPRNFPLRIFLNLVLLSATFLVGAKQVILSLIVIYAIGSISFSGFSIARVKKNVVVGISLLVSSLIVLSLVSNSRLLDLIDKTRIGYIIQIWSASILPFGHGIGSAEQLIGVYPHNIFFQMFYELGYLPCIIGFCILCFYFYAVILFLSRQKSLTYFPRETAFLFYASLYSILVSSFSGDLLVNSQFFLYTSAFLGFFYGHAGIRVPALPSFDNH